MRTIQWEGLVTALSSISHNGGDSFGTDTLLRREKFVQPDGTVAEVPVISGNSIRGVLRDRGMMQMCRALGYGEANGDDRPRGLSVAAFYFLFSGGSLVGGDKSVDIDEARNIRELIPLVSVFGGARRGEIMNGRLKCGKLIPICAETAHLLPMKYAEQGKQTIYEYLQREMYTRKDDEKNEKLRSVIDPGTRKLLEAARQERMQKNERGAAQEDTGQHQQMMYHVETLAAGTRFFWRLVLEDVADLEFEAFCATLVEFGRMPYIGGKSGTGLGEVAVRFDDWLELDSRAHTSGTALAPPLGSLYARHLSERGDEIRTMLSTVRLSA